MKQISELVRILGSQGPVYIQTHDYPDFDSVSTAFGLQYLLKQHNISARIIYEGDIHRDSLQHMIDTLGIAIRHNEAYSITSRDRSIIVDGCKGNRNVSGLVARETAVIDHHVIDDPENVDYVDIRPGCGACATIIVDYFNQLKMEIPRNVATALLIGITMDTGNLTQSVHERDLEAHRQLYAYADVRQVNSIVSNYIQARDLPFYRAALENLVLHNRFAFCYFPEGCSQNLLGILADFFLGLRDADFVALCANNPRGINISVRSKKDEWDASRIVRSVLRGAGSGGGHRHMAGGSIKNITLFDVDRLYRRFCRLLSIPLGAQRHLFVGNKAELNPRPAPEPFPAHSSECSV